MFWGHVALDPVQCPAPFTRQRAGAAVRATQVDFDEVLSCNTIRDFERALMLPIYGHDDIDTYYEHNNCKDALKVRLMSLAGSHGCGWRVAPCTAGQYGV